MTACAKCKRRLDARNRTGFCQPCWTGLPLARRMRPENLREFLATVPAHDLVNALQQRGVAVEVRDVE